MKGFSDARSASSVGIVLFAVFISGVVVYGASFAWYMLSRFDLVNLLRDVNTDDSFYYFQIAKNMAAGHFSTFDGGITQTNGYHPLWLLLITPFYWVFDTESALFAIKAFEIMLVAGGAALVIAAARAARLPWILLFAALPLLYGHRALYSGMEAAAGLFMLGLFILAICLYARDAQRWQWALAAVAFALPWVRLEYAAISISATALIWLLNRPRQNRPRQHRQPGAPITQRLRPMRLRPFQSRNAARPLFGAAAGMLLYFVYNRVVFGGFTPVSGATKRAWSQALWEQQGGYSLTQNLRETLQIGVFDYELAVALEACAYLIAVWASTRASRTRSDRLLLAFLIGIAALAVGHIAKFAQTVLTIHPEWGSYDWYFVPAYLLSAIIIPVRCYVAIHFTRKLIAPIHPRAAKWLSTAIVIAGAALLLATADLKKPYRAVDDSQRWTSGTTWILRSYMGVQVMNRILPDDSIVGSWDAGVIGYFSRHPVVNLDGLVNSYDFLHLTKRHHPWPRSRPLSSYRPFEERFGITHYANVRGYDEVSADQVLFAGPPEDRKRWNEIFFQLWSPESVPASDQGTQIWEALKPRFSYQSDEVGIVRHGRLAQAIFKECTPGQLTAWHWPDRDAPRPSFQEWSGLRRNPSGLCAASIILPSDRPFEVQARAITLSAFLAETVGDREPDIRSTFDVYLEQGRLIYTKEPCGADDINATFFVHIVPDNADDLPGRRRRHGFDNLDFRLHDHDGQTVDTCLVWTLLPPYDISTIRTGQYEFADGEYQNLWEGEIRVD